jgi:hypothetical protein
MSAETAAAPTPAPAAPPPQRLAALLIASFVIVQGLVLLAGTPFEDTGLLPIAHFAQGRQGRDSWDPMAFAYLHATTPHRIERPFYWRTAFSPQVIRKGYQYPPTALLVVAALDATVGERWPDALRWITWAMIPATVVIVWRLYARLAARGRLPPASEAVLAALAAWAVLTFYPLMRAYANGQMQTWLNAAFAAAVWCWATGRKGTAGALLALSCAVKPQLGLFLVWGALRRQWAFARAFAAVSAVVWGVSLLRYGWEPHVGYLGMLRFLADHGEAFWPNQSVNGLLQRWWLNGDILFWKQPWVDHFPPYDPRIYWATVVTSAALVALAWFGPAAQEQGGGLVDFGLMGVIATMASPIAWEHHYGVLLPVFVTAWAALRAAGAGRAWQAALALSYVLCGNCLWITKRLAASRLNVLESYLFFGAIVLVVVLVRCRRDPRAAA